MRRAPNLSPYSSAWMPGYRLLVAILSLTLLLAACNLPVGQTKTVETETPLVSAPPTATPEPLPTATGPVPPTIVETLPLSQGQLTGTGGVRLTFDQAMDHSSVEAALEVNPAYAGRFEWSDDYTVQFIPEHPFPPQTEVTVTVGESAHAQTGENLLRPLTYTFQSSGSLRVVDRLPDMLASPVDPNAQIIVTFNRPVAPLGDSSNTPAAFRITPEVSGSGKWLNTSTYQFIPEPDLAGGTSYTVTVDPQLTALDGAALEDTGNLEWSFSTALPAIVDILPPADNMVLLDAQFAVTFNQAMDTADVEQHLSVLDESGSALPGAFSWNADETEVTFTADALLARESAVRLVMEAVHSRGGVILDERIDRTYRTVGAFSVGSVVPGEGEPFQTYGDFGYINYQFNSPLAIGQNLVDLVKVEPAPSNLRISSDFDLGTLYLSGVFTLGASYTVTISGALKDRYGGTLGADYSKTFVVENTQPTLSMPMTWSVGSQLFATAQDKTVSLTATNIRTLSIGRSSLSLPEYLQYFSFQGRPTTREADLAWQQTLEIPANTNTAVNVNLDPEQIPLSTGLYYYQITSPQLSDSYSDVNFGLAVSSAQLTLKESRSEVLVWAVGLSDREPLAGRTVALYDAEGVSLGAATTDQEGLAHLPLPADREQYLTLIAVLGQPGGAEFAVATTQWNSGLSGWEFGIPTDTNQMDQLMYLYTDRPIYQPGQTVFFRSIVKQVEDARYQSSPKTDVRLQIYGSYATETGISPLLDEPTLPLSMYGTANGAYTLAADAVPGTYSITYNDGNYWASTTFTVADYRKPEMDVSVTFVKEAYQHGEDIQAVIKAEYYSGEPAANATINWTLTAQQATILMPDAGYTIGPLDTSWLEPYAWRSFTSLMNGGYLLNGTAATGPDGQLPLTFSGSELDDLLELDDSQTLMLQATLNDESGLSVTQTAETPVYPSETFIGILPDTWLVMAGETARFQIQTTDWGYQPKAQQTLRADFERIEWQQTALTGLAAEDSFEEVLTPVSSADFSTNERGLASLEFVPETPGNYRLRVTGADGALSDFLLWVTGPGQTAWPALPDQHIMLELDQTEYQAGDTARLFIPNPFAGKALALLTVERGAVLSTQVLRIEGSSVLVDVPVDELYAPNVYISVTLLGETSDGRADFRQGYIEMPVNADALSLQVQVTPSAEKYEPGQTAQWDVTVTDLQGSPVQGEFSFVAVDKAIYALKDPVERDIFSAFYGEQPLGITTSTSLSAYLNRLVAQSPGLGGGGGGGDLMETAALRNDYKDTAYWSGSFETNAAGEAQIEFSLPDNLTTWVITVRGLTRDVRVGEAQTEIQVSKPLTVRSAVPRFLVVGDHVQLGAVVHNDTGAEQTVTVQLQAQGVTLDTPDQAVQTITLASGERQRVNWWATVQDVGSAALRFSAQSDSYSDASVPPWGDIPIQRYAASQTFATAGVLNAAGETQEVVSLPRSYTATGGELAVEMSSTLVGTLVSSLEALEATPTYLAEPTLSRLLANLSAFSLMRETDLQSPDLENKLRTAIRSDLDWLLLNQKTDGGWGWSSKDESDLFLNSYALLVFNMAKTAGFQMDTAVVDLALTLVQNSLELVDMETPVWQLDRLAFAYYTLQQSGVDVSMPFDLLEQRTRLNPWAQALLALTVQDSDPELMRTVLSDLESTAVRSATGVHWSDQEQTYRNFASPLSNTAMVVYALAELDPASTALTDALRYIISNRRANGGWASSFDTGWILASLTRAALATGDLQASFDYSATLNSTPLASGSAQGMNTITPAHAEVAVSQLAAAGNILEFSRGEGSGRLYYKANLTIGQPVEDVPALESGFSIQREYYLESDACTPEACEPVATVDLNGGSPVVKAVLTLTVPEDSYYLMVEDFIPAGAEIVDLQLNTAPAVFEGITSLPVDGPMADGWGWWYFNQPTIYRDHLRWTGSYVPAGTYVLSYRLQVSQPGEYRVLPAHAFEYYFPEVEGHSSGAVFTINE